MLDVKRQMLNGSFLAPSITIYAQIDSTFPRGYHAMLAVILIALLVDRR
jgi:hypothetical protein